MAFSQQLVRRTLGGHVSSASSSSDKVCWTAFFRAPLGMRRGGVAAVGSPWTKSQIALNVMDAVPGFASNVRKFLSVHISLSNKICKMITSNFCAIYAKGSLTMPSLVPLTVPGS